MKKRLFTLVCILALVMSLFGCSNEKKEAIKYDEAALKANITAVFNETVSTTKEIAETRAAYYKTVEFKTEDEKAVYELLIKSLESWATTCEETGKYKEILNYNTKATDESVTVTMKVQFEKKVADYVCVISEEEPSVSFNIHYTIQEKMQKAGVNTLLGMGTVFVVLIIIIFIISLFKYIGKIEDVFKKKDAEPTISDTAIDNTIAQIVQKEELSDDLELVAVITAAITAYESSKGGSTSGLVVRSIKKANKSKWQNAM